MTMASERIIVLVFDFHRTIVSAQFVGPISTSEEKRWSGGEISRLGSTDDRHFDFFDFELMSELFRRGPSVGVIVSIATNLGNRWDCYAPSDIARIRRGEQVQQDCDAWISGRRAVMEWLKLLYSSTHAMRDLLPEELVQAIAPTGNTPDEEYKKALQDLAGVMDLSTEQKHRMALGEAGKNRHITNILSFLRGTRHPHADELIGRLSMADQVVFFDDRPVNTEMAQRWGVVNSITVNPMLGVQSRTWPAMVDSSSVLAEVHERLWPGVSPDNLHNVLHARPLGSSEFAGSPDSSPPLSPRQAAAAGTDAQVPSNLSILQLALSWARQHSPTKARPVVVVVVVPSSIPVLCAAPKV